MFGKYAATSFEVEAERRREILAASMRDARGHWWTVYDESREADRRSEASEHHRLAGIAAIVGLLGRALQRA
jgi:hypothetical protein